MNKLLFIVGPTATGKTSLALKLAHALGGELISADSRQVYQGMDIGTGKDLPRNVKCQMSNVKWNNQKICYYLINRIKVWGYDLVSSGEEFSLSHFAHFAREVIKDLWRRQKLPIVVGGTGLYLQSLIRPPKSLHIPPSKKLRSKLQKLTLDSLQKQLQKLDNHRFNQMNQSDQKNPRRLIRAIEIALYQKRSKNQSDPNTVQYLGQSTEVLWIGLKAPLQELDQRIDKRVISRISHGMTKEVNRLTSTLKKKNLPSTTAIGYRQWLAYLEGKITKTAAVRLWQRAEHQYARRQLTWFKKQPNVHWFDVSKKNFLSKVVDTAKTWYAKTRKS